MATGDPHWLEVDVEILGARASFGENGWTGDPGLVEMIQVEFEHGLLSGEIRELEAAKAVSKAAKRYDPDGVLPNRVKLVRYKPSRVKAGEVI